MNKEEIDKWLFEEYGLTYTDLEELHDYLKDKNIKQEKEINRLNNIINELDKYLIEQSEKCWCCNNCFDNILDKLEELKENKE